MSDLKLYDKTGREIMIFDVLKVFHFIGVRRKKHYMYHQVSRIVKGEDGRLDRFKISHLCVEGSYYNKLINGDVLMDYEIVQGEGVGMTFYEDRPRLNINEGKLRCRYDFS